MACSHCTGPGMGTETGPGNNGFLYYSTVHTTPRQGRGRNGNGTIGLNIHFHISASIPCPTPVPSAVQCE